MIKTTIIWLLSSTVLLYSADDNVGFSGIQLEENTKIGKLWKEKLSKLNKVELIQIIEDGKALYDRVIKRNDELTEIAKVARGTTMKLSIRLAESEEEIQKLKEIIKKYQGDNEKPKHQLSEF